MPLSPLFANVLASQGVSPTRSPDTYPQPPVSQVLTQWAGPRSTRVRGGGDTEHCPLHFIVIHLLSAQDPVGSCHCAVLTSVPLISSPLPAHRLVIQCPPQTAEKPSSGAPGPGDRSLWASYRVSGSSVFVQALVSGDPFRQGRPKPLPNPSRWRSLCQVCSL